MNTRPRSRSRRGLKRRLAAIACLLVASPLLRAQQELFDDFRYDNPAQMANNGWIVRTWEGGPGLSDGTWRAQNVTFVRSGAARSVRLTSSTNVNSSAIANNRSKRGSSSQAEIARSEQIYKSGTWAARMYFNDAPAYGPDGDSVVQTFFGITPYIEGREPYSEIDFEYLANGGWYSGSAQPAMWSGTYRIVDWSDPTSHRSTRTVGSLQGWHTLLMQLVDGHIKFFIDGKYQTGFRGAVTPDNPMFMMFQIWFSNDCFDPACKRPGYLPTSVNRAYYEDIDWVYYQKDTILNTWQVRQRVGALRKAGVRYRQTVSGAN